MTDELTIVDLGRADTKLIAQLAQLLFASFTELSPGWLPDVAAGREVVLESLEPGRLSRILLDGELPVGWAAGVHAYGFVWELHPLVVSANHRRRGYGRRLVQDMERLVAARGALTLQLGTSDETNRTTVFGTDLYDEPADAISQIRTTRDHPLDFYRAVGFTVVGLVPDAEGRGKPTIVMAKRVEPP
jgi:aminoglycoside 6'-N-acetyltransferase I